MSADLSGDLLVIPVGVVIGLTVTGLCVLGLTVTGLVWFGLSIVRRRRL